MAIIEKKYLLKDSVQNLIAGKSLKKKSIAQFYTKIELCKEIRYKRENNKTYKTIRTGSAIRKDISHKKIDHKNYLKAKKDKIGKVLKKNRYYIKNSDFNCTVDAYKKHLKGLYILEITFDTPDKASSYTLPEVLKPFIKKDVSENNRYRNKNLARLGNPYKTPYNIYTLFKEISHQETNNIHTLLFPEMSVSDAVRIILYKIYTDLKFDAQKLIVENDIKALDRFRKDLKEAKIIMREYRCIFEKQMLKQVLSHLETIEKTIEIDKDLSVIRENLPLLESVFDEKEVNSFIAKIDKRIEHEKHKVTSFFKTREFSIIFSQFNLLILEPSNIQSSIYSDTSIGFYSQESLEKHFSKFIETTDRYSDCHDFSSYKKIRKSLFKTKVLLENFAVLFSKKEYKKMHTLLSQSETKLCNFINLHKRSLIIKTYLRNSTKSLQVQQKHIIKIRKKRKALEKEIIKEIDHSVQNIKAYNKEQKSKS